MARGGKRPGAGRKPNPHKGKKEPIAPAPEAARTYDPTVAHQAKKLCELGATDIELADFFNVSVRTIYRWSIEFPEFCHALRAGKEAPDDRVERSLYHRAVGFSYDAVKIFMPAGARAPVYAPYREYVPPDTAAASLWLRNRRKDEWRDKQSHEQAGPHGGPITLEALLMARIKRKELPKPGGSSQ
jgi:hypothetical protein